ncbi:aldolase, partial [Rhodococcus sp. G-MC3]|nr:aldolase [Rhodococcus sp. G-MC3]
MSETTLTPAAASTYAGVTALRATDPQAIERAWATRTTRPTIRGNGRLMIVAADHPARGALSVGANPA